MNDFQQKLQNEARQISLSSQEKSAMRAALSRVMEPQPVHSPYAPFIAHFSRLPQQVLAAVLIVFVAGGGTAYAAQSSLPGDALYSVKVNVAEPIEGALQLTPQAKAAWHASVAETRVKEAETLASQNKLTSADATELAANFNENASAAAHIAQSMMGDATTSQTLPAELAVTLQAHSAVLSALAATAPSTTTSNAALALADTVSSQAQSILAGDTDTNSGTPVATPTNATSSSTSSADMGAHSGPRIALAVHPKHATFGVGTSTVRTAFLNISASTSVESTSSTATNTVSSDASTSTPSAARQPNQAEIERLRDSAESSITDLQTQLSATQAALDSDTASKLSDGVSRAQKLIAQGDAASGGEALGDYLSALKLSLSLQTYVQANQQFPASHVLQTLLGKEGDASQPQ